MTITNVWHRTSFIKSRCFSLQMPEILQIDSIVDAENIVIAWEALIGTIILPNTTTIHPKMDMILSKQKCGFPCAFWTIQWVNICSHIVILLALDNGWGLFTASTWFRRSSEHFWCPFFNACISCVVACFCLFFWTTSIKLLLVFILSYQSQSYVSYFLRSHGWTFDGS